MHAAVPATHAAFDDMRDRKRRPTSAMSVALFLNVNTVVRATTRSPRTFETELMICSVILSLKFS